MMNYCIIIIINNEFSKLFLIFLSTNPNDVNQDKVYLRIKYKASVSSYLDNQCEYILTLMKMGPCFE